MRISYAEEIATGKSHSEIAAGLVVFAPVTLKQKRQWRGLLPWYKAPGPSWMSHLARFEVVAELPRTLVNGVPSFDRRLRDLDSGAIYYANARFVRDRSVLV